MAYTSADEQRQHRNQEAAPFSALHQRVCVNSSEYPDDATANLCHSATMKGTRGGTTLAARMHDGPPILIDGGTGTELERAGAGMHQKAWSARASLTDPQVVRDVHAAFLDAGAEMIIANTYSANYHVMAAAGLSEEFEPANRRALELALEARTAALNANSDRQIWVAGSMSTTTFTPGIDESTIATGGRAGDGYGAQARIIAEADVDLVVLEMMRDVRETRLCLAAAAETGLPVWLGLSVERRESGALVLYGSKTPLAQGVTEILDGSPQPQAAGIMHSQLELTSQALEDLQSVWSGPLFAYPHHGVFEMPHWRFDNTLSAEEFARAALAWVEAGAAAVGGCCGIRADHIAALRRHLELFNES